jgi:hypothetical protein
MMEWREARVGKNPVFEAIHLIERVQLTRYQKKKKNPMASYASNAPG